MVSGILNGMKKPWLIIVIIGAIIGLATAYILLMHRPVSTPAGQDTAAAQQPAPDAAPQTQTQPAGTYTAYNPEAIAKTQGRQIIFFHAPWCPQCRALEQSIQSGSIPAGVTIYKTDYDTSTDLRQKYGVTIQTTLVEIDSSGRLIQKYVAYDTPSLDAVIKAMKL